MGKRGEIDMRSIKQRMRPDLNFAALTVCFGVVFAFASPAWALTATDNFTGASASSSLNWQAINGACLTAGNNSGTVPACQGLAYYSGCSGVSPSDTVGNGALRLTNSCYSENGAIVSGLTFPSNQGLQVTFTTYSYSGDYGGLASDGADGIGFFLMDGSVPGNIGSWGGSLGYTCSNSNAPYTGTVGAYLGLGIDEYGNFLNQGDNTASGILNSNAPGGSTANGTNSYYSAGPPSNGWGDYYQPDRIGLRGAGNISWSWMNATYPNYYPSSLSSSSQQSAVQNTCSTGMLWDYSTSSPSITTTSVMDYPAIPNGYAILPDSQPIAVESASQRSLATPITYKLRITQTGLLSFWYSYNNGVFQPVLTNQSITASNGPLPSSFRFGFTGSTGGSDNAHEITCFEADTVQSTSSAGTNTIQSGQVKTGTQVYLAYYHTDNWWGQLVSNPLVTSSGTVSASTVANWDASCVLTGGACPSMGTNSSGVALTTITAESPSSRQLLTWNPASTPAVGIPLEWSNLTSAQQTDLNSTDSLGQKRLNWLRGDRSQEQQNAGVLRERTGVLGDIIDSSPTWVGSPAMNYTSPFTDAIYGSTSAPENASGAQVYSQFATNNATRLNVVYSGSNDGLLHGFRSGSFNADGSYNSTYNDGLEVLGYMPAGVLASSNVVSLTSPVYAHNYFVDATPGTGDLFYNGTWHTWLVGGMGPGGAEIYALDITNPSPSNFSESNAANLVMGDWTAATLVCTNVSGCGSDLGNTFGTPLIRRLHNGQWAMIFGNGLGSATGHAGVFIGLIDSVTHAVTFRWLDTGSGSSTTPDGIAFVGSADLDGDHVTDYLYAGDLQGKVWRFDLTSSNPADWAASKFGNGSPTPLYTALDSGGTPQPITTKIAVAATKAGGQERVLVMFGTGRKIPATTSTPDTFLTSTQSVYGVWDWDMNKWDNGTTTALGVTIPPSGTKYAALAAPRSFTRSALQVQTVTSQTAGTSGSQVLGYRSISANTVCWLGSTSCSSGNNMYGWYIDLPGTYEQVIYNPIIANGALVLNTTIPTGASTSSCVPQTPTGWTMAFDIASGGAYQQNFFPDKTGAFTVGSGGTSISGIQVNGVGSPWEVTVGSTPYIITQTVSGNAVVSQINPQSGIITNRVTWEELR